MAIFVHRIVPLALNQSPRVIDGHDFHRAAKLIHPDFPVADHDAQVADEQIVRLGGDDGLLDIGREDSRVIGPQGSGVAVERRPPRRLIDPQRIVDHSRYGRAFVGGHRPLQPDDKLSYLGRVRDAKRSKLPPDRPEECGVPVQPGGNRPNQLRGAP
jgi:hypothetical protein